MRFRSVLLAGVLLLLSAPAFSQCSMCYSAAKATPMAGQRALNRGVMVLLVPPLGFMTLGVWMAYRYGRKRDEEQDSRSVHQNVDSELRALRF